MYETEYQLEMSTLLVIAGSFKVEFEIGDKVHLTSARWSHQVYGALWIPVMNYSNNARPLQKEWSYAC